MRSRIGAVHFGLLVGGMAFAQAAWPNSAIVAGTPQVVDGDGLTFDEIEVRVHGIDAPEVGQRCVRAGGESWDAELRHRRR